MFDCLFYFIYYSTFLILNFSHFLFHTGIADIGVVEELLVMKLIEKRQRRYQLKLDDRVKKKNRLKNRDGNNMKIRNKKEKKIISEQNPEKHYEVTVKEQSEELPSLSADRVPLDTDKNNDNVTPSTTSTAFDKNEVVNRNLLEQKSAVKENVLPLLKAISVATGNVNSGNRSQITETRNNSTFGSSSFGSPPAPPLADSPNVNTDTSESEIEDETQEQQSTLDSTFSNILNLQVQSSVQPPHARTLINYQQQGEGDGGEGGGGEVEEVEVEDEEEEDDEEDEEDEEEETEEEENEREEIEERDRFDESQAMYMEALLGKEMNTDYSDGFKWM